MPFQAIKSFSKTIHYTSGLKHTARDLFQKIENADKW